jgi:Clp amino terminal domain, pathogenicity island component
MFERFTQSARRIIIFARHEAATYGSPYIDSEHLLLGVLREDRQLANRFLGEGDIISEIRTAIERRTAPPERTPTDEIPLSSHSKTILKVAAHAAEQFGRRHIETEHLLFAMATVENSLAARLLHTRGLTEAKLRQRLANDPQIPVLNYWPPSRDPVKIALNTFLAGLKRQKADQLIDSFAENAQLTDVQGKTWARAEILQNFENLFAPYAKKNAAARLENIETTPDNHSGQPLRRHPALAQRHRHQPTTQLAQPHARSPDSRTRPVAHPPNPPNPTPTQRRRMNHNSFFPAPLLTELFAALIFLSPSGVSSPIKGSPPRQNLNAHPSSPDFAALAKQIHEMLVEDQAVRTTNPISAKRMKEVDDKNSPVVKNIFQKYGWPTITMLGTLGAQEYFVLVQHQDLQFQESALPAMEQAVANKEALKSNYAYLYDRVMVGEGKLQHWGTQGTCKDGKAALEPVDDPTHLEDRRRQAGIYPPSIDEYLKFIEPQCKNMQYDLPASPKPPNH